jgi:6-pyruvoyltetrahydropterin/6-carboxytetrahydropterin synthase
MFITRKAEFSASHLCRVSGWPDEKNVEIYGQAANPNGHGHNYVLEVTIAGEPDPVTGMIMDLKELNTVLDAEVIESMDHRFLNFEVPPFDKVVPTAENIAVEIWRRLAGRLSREKVGRLHRVRLYETSDLYVDVTGEDFTA